LQLGLYLGEQDKNRSLTYSTGIYLAIHNNSFQSILPDNGLNIPTSELTSISNILITVKSAILKRYRYIFVLNASFFKMINC
jgi:hypothetical protein